MKTKTMVIANMLPEEYLKAAGSGNNYIGAGSKNFWDSIQRETIELRKKNPALNYDAVFQKVALEKAAESIKWYSEHASNRTAVCEDFGIN